MVAILDGNVLRMSAMKALEHLLVQEITKIRKLEAELQSAYPTLHQAAEDQIAGFAAGLAELDRRATRVDELLGVFSLPQAA